MNGSENSRFADGQPLGRYAILEKIGEGGSGVVYKARDTELNRLVALKVLTVDKPGGSRDERFHREARAASSLSHPNITTVFEIGKAGDAEFIAMEYVPGGTLAAILESGKLPWREAVEYGVQIADAVAAAHEVGVIHRDLKPANIMITGAGLVKVLDFGLAKVTGSEIGDRASTEASPIVTEDGSVSGACAYMSPEQAQGRRVDTRSDIFSFGALLYEMVTGQRAYFASTSTGALTAVVRDHPRPVRDVPKDLAKIIERCLRKSPSRRYQHMDDVKRALEELLEPARRKAGRRALAAFALSAAAALVVVAAWRWISGPSAGQPRTRDLTPLTRDAGLSVDPAISRDGALLAYASDRADGRSLDIWIRQIAGGEPARLTSDEADERQPSFSPDGTKVAFRSERDGGGVYVVDALGGEPRLLAEGGRDPRFSPDGTRVAYWQGEPYTGSGAQVFIVAADGGPPERAAAAFSDARYPIWSPDSTQLALVGSYNNRRDWWVQPLDGNRPTAMGGYEILRMQGFRVDASAPGALAAPSVWQNDAILFASVSGETASLWRAPYSAGMGQVTGSAERLTFGNGWDSQPSASENGKVVFSGSTIDLDIWSAPLNANTGKVQGNLQRVVQGGGRDYQPSISRDGTRLVYRSNRNGQECIWVKDLVSGKEMEHCDNHLENIPASISPSGTRIAYRARGRVHAMNPDGSEDRFICRGCRPWGWFPDDKQLLVQYGSRRVSVIAEGEPESREVLRGEDHALSEAHPSPDGKWIAFHQIMGPNGRQVFVAPFADKESVRQKEWIPITGESANDRNAQWSPDGNLLYFLSERDGFRCVWAQRLDPRTKRPRGGPFGVQHFHHARLSLMHPTNPGDIGLSVARDRLVLSVFERTGNIWMLRAER